MLIGEKYKNDVVRAPNIHIAHILCHYIRHNIIKIFDFGFVATDFYLK